ncbi:hypothetical protein LTR36_006108 [Oleoguttula mirabilis]|uniref:Uncharacterized protein n=1 Tax=Oleoguttula mirabilis TaxID=1507867 RepID=A0AAV9JCR1_9PEZI|nr:hypothetical protein LTR36_006108 [Oleoguttula mirabilis]
MAATLDLPAPASSTTDNSSPPPPRTAPDPNAALQALLADSAHARLSTPFAFRLPLATTIAAATGFLLGISHGTAEAGLRFRAENAHRFPTTQTGWYLYHKSKNYHILLGGIKEGVRMAGKQAVWVGVFFGMEECIDRGRAGVVRQWRRRGGKGVDVGVGVGVREEERAVAGNRDFVSSVLAGLGTAGAFSAWNRFPVPTAARVAKMGAKVGLAFGLLQDATSLLRGRRLGYVEFVKRHTIGMSKPLIESDGVAATAG